MQSVLLDSFDDLSAWQAISSGQARLDITQDQGPHGKSMRLDFDFQGGGGFVVARKLFSLPLPEAYAFSFNLCGRAPPNKFEFKLLDTSNQNVWRYQREAFDFTTDWRPVRIKSSQIEFAWGPAGSGTPDQIGAIELVISAPPGGKGTVWIADLQFEDDSFRSMPVVQALSALPGHEARFALDGSAATSWRSEFSAEPQWLLIDFQEEREYGGLVIQWEPTTRERNFDIQTSNDGAVWQTVYSASQAIGERSYVYLPNSASRFLRLNLHQGMADKGLGIVDLSIKPYDFSCSINAFFQNIAKHERKGLYPRYLYGEQSYWSPAGVPESVSRALLNEEGMVEVDGGMFSIEPFLYWDNRLITWADAFVTQALEQDYLPIPSCLWRSDAVLLKITAFAAGDPGKTILYIRYRLENTRDRWCQIRFFAVLRPFQVTPPWQSFHRFGGFSPVRELDYRSDAVWVNRSKAVIPLTAATQFGATRFDQGAITEYLKAGQLPSQTQVSDAFGCASGALDYELKLAPGAAEELYLAVPFDSAVEFTPGELAGSLPTGLAGGEQFEAAVRDWQAKLGKVAIRLPSTAQGATDTFKTAAAHILINRDGPALQPGPRRYTRCWIRDGAIMAAALLRMGCSHEIRDFIRWYASYQAADGNIPCCVDYSGADWLAEYDSLGEFIFTIMDYFRFTGDRALLSEMWPGVLKTVDYLETLRKQRLTADYQTPAKQARYGLLPESASHEGYLAHPVHAYWDDFWALRGLRDAAAMAEILGDRSQILRLAALRDAFQETLGASLRTTIAERQLDYIPGSVEWADFDPTATANAIELLGALPNVPETVVEHTFEQFLSVFREKHRGPMAGNNYTPYEIRIIGALVRLGQRRSAHELLQFFLADRRPPAWNQWPEIAWRDPRTPAHLGDIPHTWISAEYILAFRSLFVFEREVDQALVIGAGIAEEWLAGEGGVVVEHLPTWYGDLSFAMQRPAEGFLQLQLSGGVQLPPGKIVLQPPGDRPLQEVLVNGKPTSNFTPTQAVIEEYPAEVLVLS